MTAPLAVVWSRPLPDGAEPSTATVSRDPAGRWFVSLLCQRAVQPHPASDKAVGVDAGITSLVTLSTGEKISNPRVRNMVRNHHLARAISDAAWRQMRTMLAYKCGWYGRDLVVIDRWYPSTTTCSGCGHRAGPLPGMKQEPRRATAGISALLRPGRSQGAYSAKGDRPAGRRGGRAVRG
jgi:putative transposase